MATLDFFAYRARDNRTRGEFFVTWATIIARISGDSFCVHRGPNRPIVISGSSRVNALIGANLCRAIASRRESKWNLTEFGSNSINRFHLRRRTVSSENEPSSSHSPGHELSRGRLTEIREIIFNDERLINCLSYQLSHFGRGNSVASLCKIIKEHLPALLKRILRNDGHPTTMSN